MSDDRMAEMLALYADSNGVRTCAVPEAVLGEEACSEFESLVELARHLETRMRPVAAPPAFVESLGRELVEEAERRIVLRKRRHRIAMISAAAAGALVSAASVVGGIVMLIRWLRTRSRGRQMSTA